MQRDVPVDADEIAAERRQVPPPGAMIRRAREGRQMSLAELAARTRLAESVLRAVESDQFGAMGQPVYARGYYRKCAQVLALNGELLVDAYEKLSGHASPVPIIAQRPSIRYREGPSAVAVATACVLFAALIGVTAWWLLIKTPAPAPAFASQLPQTPAADALPATPASELNATAPSAEPLLSATPAPQPEVQALAPPEPRLELSATGGESWATVTDGAGERLLYRSLKTGESVDLLGQPPYEVTLGRGDFVEVRYAGWPVDLAQQLSKSVKLRFRIGTAADATGGEAP